MAESRQTMTTAEVPAAGAPTFTYGTRLSARGAFLVNAAFVVGLLALSQLPLLDARPIVRASMVGAAAVLLAWSLLLFGVLLRRQTVSFEVALRPQHYLQACLQGSLILYWGFYWREVYHAAPLILAQLLFAYAFDSLLSWTHRRTFALGFGPFPIIFSLTLFFWFKDEWFYWQFVMVAIGFLAKEFLRWQRDGRNTHIFNPSSFPLAVVSVVLLYFGATDMTWGFFVAQTEFYPPLIFLVIFLVGLPGQFLFGVAPMTFAAVTTTFLFSQFYFYATGSYYFVDAHVPVAVFIGMTLLFTDPATSPRTLVGRLAYGVFYGLTTVLLYDLLLDANTPGFYDKLLQVPLLNLSVKLLDRLAFRPALKALDPSTWARDWAPRRRHLAYMSVYAAAFVAMSASGYLGDKHPGQWTPFWEQACAAERRDACLNLYLLHDGYCADGSAWSCNEVGILLAERYDNRVIAAAAFNRACTLQFAAACDNAVALANRRALRHDAPTAADYRHILRGSKGPIEDLGPAELYARACDLGWPGSCQS
ncbi:MAG TPA: hypothetical protein VLI71_11355 [Gammaproteobacteria bacterium]|nr:hypothetical protein [Gammaproteobacteria bacterium]